MPTRQGGSSWWEGQIGCGEKGNQPHRTCRLANFPPKRTCRLVNFPPKRTCRGSAVGRVGKLPRRQAGGQTCWGAGDRGCKRAYIVKHILQNRCLEAARRLEGGEQQHEAEAVHHHVVCVDSRHGCVCGVVLQCEVRVHTNRCPSPTSADLRNPTAACAAATGWRSVGVSTVWRTVDGLAERKNGASRFSHSNASRRA